MIRAIGRDGAGSMRALLEAVVEGVEQVGRLGRAVLEQLAGDVAPIDQPRA